jgi:hypothetical protein
LEKIELVALVMAKPQLVIKTPKAAAYLTSKQSNAMITVNSK